MLAWVKNGRNRLSWPETAMNLAFDIAKYRSEDPYVQVGAVIIKNDGSMESASIGQTETLGEIGFCTPKLTF